MAAQACAHGAASVVNLVGATTLGPFCSKVLLQREEVRQVRSALNFAPMQTPAAHVTIAHVRSKSAFA